jgi:hypothetical protein
MFVSNVETDNNSKFKNDFDNNSSFVGNFYLLCIVLKTVSSLLIKTTAPIAHQKLGLKIARPNLNIHQHGKRSHIHKTLCFDTMHDIQIQHLREYFKTELSCSKILAPCTNCHFTS